MASGQTGKSRLDNVARTMLVGIFINKTIGTTRRDSSSENALSFLTGPFTGLFALLESLNCTSCQGGASSLCNALLALIALAATVTTAGA